ncbi:MAG: hypothetical protein ACLFWL_12645 [Candidatus Brocadiia bacterium]
MVEEKATDTKGFWKSVIAQNIAKLLVATPFTVIGSIALLRAERKDIPKIIAALFGSKLLCVLGWILLLFVLVIAIIVVKWTLKFTHEELDRVCQQRDELQSRLLDKDVPHSNGSN